MLESRAEVDYVMIVASPRPAQQGGPGGPWPTQHICNTRLCMHDRDAKHAKPRSRAECVHRDRQKQRF